MKQDLKNIKWQNVNTFTLILLSKNAVSKTVILQLHCKMKVIVRYNIAK